MQWVLTPIRRMKAGQLRIAGDGLGVMNHVYVDNLVDALFLLLQQRDQTGGRAFNVTDGTCHPVRPTKTR